MTMTTPRSRRWFLGAMAAAAAAPPFLASAQTERPNPGNRGKGDTTPTALQGAPSDIYTSPALGMEVTWSSPWFERERSAADSFATMGEESITLNADGMYGFVGIYGIDPTRDAPTPSGLLDVYEGLMEQKLADLNGPPTTVALHQRLESSLTVLFVIETGNGPSVELWELRVPPAGGYATYSLAYSPVEDFPRLFDAAQGGITLNGGAPYAAVAAADILAAANQPAIEQTTTTDPSSTALSWTSPVFGMQVTWEAPWEEAGLKESADKGYERITLRPSSNVDHMSLTTSQISANFPSAAAYLDHYQEAYSYEKIVPLRRAIDGVHFLVQERTETSVTVFLHYRHRDTNGSVFELYEHRAEPGAELATSSIMVVNRGEVFPGHLRGAQMFVTMNGGTPYSTIDTEAVVALATSALDGQIVGQTGQTTTQTGGTTQTGQTTTQTGGTAALAPVRQHFNQLRPTIDEFVGLVNSTPWIDAQVTRATDILNLWLDAPTVAAGITLPPEFAEISSAYLAYADNLSRIGIAFLTFISPDSTDAQKDTAAAELETALTANADLAANLDALLTAAGA